MIQRIQSLYLLVSTILMGLTFFAPVASFTVASGDIYTLTTFSLSSAEVSQSTIWMGILMVIATVLPLVTIFLFKRRMLQVRLCAVEIVLLLGCIAFEAIYRVLTPWRSLLLSIVTWAGQLLCLLYPWYLLPWLLVRHSRMRLQFVHLIV